MNPAIIIGLLPQLIETAMKIYTVIMESGALTGAEKEEMVKKMREMRDRVNNLKWEEDGE